MSQCNANRQRTYSDYLTGLAFAGAVWLALGLATIATTLTGAF